MKRVDIFRIAIAVSALFAFCSANSQVPVGVRIKGDLVSSYICRGAYQAGPSFQPQIGLDVGNFALTVWGSTDFEGHASNDGQLSKEIDIILAYNNPCGLSFLCTDYWLDCMEDQRFFSFAPRVTGHIFEGSVAYTLPVEKFPLYVRWNTIFAGHDFNYDGRRAWSSYCELTYPIKVKNVDVDCTVGFVPYKSQDLYGCNGFIVRNLQVKATYTVHACAGLDIPIFTKLVGNPNRETLDIVFGISLVPTALF